MLETRKERLQSINKGNQDEICEEQYVIKITINSKCNQVDRIPEQSDTMTETRFLVSSVYDENVWIQDFMQYSQPLKWPWSLWQQFDKEEMKRKEREFISVYWRCTPHYHRYVFIVRVVLDLPEAIQAIPFGQIIINKDQGWLIAVFGILCNLDQKGKRYGDVNAKYRGKKIISRFRLLVLN